VNKEVDCATAKLKEPPKPVNKEDTENDRKRAAKEDNKDKSKRRPPKLPFHSSSTDKLQNSIGKSPNIDLDLKDKLEDVESNSNDDDGDDPQKLWKLITTLNAPNKQNLEKAAQERRERGLRERDP
jgi:hypothetical protein